MDLDAFRALLARAAPPPALAPELRALLLDGRGDPDGAHALVQDLASPGAAWIHAYLHRKEGDIENAGYWYARAGRERSHGSFGAEWAEIARELLALT
jgi:hypothetical protein